MARIELSNIGGGGTTLSLTTTGTSGAATLAGSVLNIPVYQGQLTLTTTGTSGAATLSGDILNIPQYSGGGTPAGSTGEIQYNNAGAFGASANLAWDNSNVRLNIGAPSAPTGRLNVKGSGTLTTVNTRLTNSSDTELVRVLDNGSTNIGANFNWDNVNSRLGIGTATPSTQLELRASSPAVPSLRLTSGSLTIPNYTGFGFSPQITTSTSVIIEQGGTTGGGLNAFGFTSSGATFGPLSFSGVFGATSPGTSNAAVQFRGYKSNGSTNVSSLSGDEIIIATNNGSAVTAQFRANGNVNIGSAFIPSARLQVRGSNTTAGVGTLIVEDGAATPATIYRIDNDGKVTYRATNTAAGTTGAQTINRPSGTVNFAAGASALVVTNSLCTTASLVFAGVRTNDATAQIKNVVPAAGSFTINLSAAATAETSVGFFIIN